METLSSALSFMILLMVIFVTIMLFLSSLALVVGLKTRSWKSAINSLVAPCIIITSSALGGLGSWVLALIGADAMNFLKAVPHLGNFVIGAVLGAVLGMALLFSLQRARALGKH